MILVFAQPSLYVKLIRLVVMYSVCILPIALAEISAILSPLASTVWVPGEQGTISYRISGEPDGESYEIDLMSGDPNNAQLVHVFEQTAEPTIAGINSVTVDIPSTIPEGTYGVRLGLPDDKEWKYSQLFSISHDGSVAADTAGDKEVVGNSFAPVLADVKDSEGDKSHTEQTTEQSESSSQTLSGRGASIASRHLALVAIIYFF
ncbi:hypothetical protein COEREDRAFT_42143 [Coemansia reversa NRRL 1564]|uniref:Uncharacterized protein n=1 Tax=Coemansia reversa (strain ATCC 12441 / NRRL 1564) TaxID=763665 RepID=A0A2G5BCC6_COERN|nr:hypothetical protein COEREDRAFT_42143 [Coemansia reversa NRRL 1564]|eukprot:PIA16651.1 hypothetical protein COEREDRAFT_42143 [Coemansia reversa NRRL 1564]